MLFVTVCMQISFGVAVAVVVVVIVVVVVDLISLSGCTGCAACGNCSVGGSCVGVEACTCFRDKKNGFWSGAACDRYFQVVYVVCGVCMF